MANLRTQDILRRISNIIHDEASDPDDFFRLLEDVNRRLRSKGLHPAYRIIYEEGYMQYDMHQYQNYPRERKALLEVLEELVERFRPA